jgi:apolipoprotein N-acyltransferase
MMRAFIRWREWITGLPVWRLLFVTIICGAFAGGAMAPFHWVILLIPSFVSLLFLVASSNNKRRAFLIGWCFGLGHFAVGFYWVGHAFLVDAASYGWMAPIAIMGLAAGIGIFPGLVTLFSWLISRRVNANVYGQVFILAAIWTTFEWVRSWIFTGFPWNLIGTVWANSDPMMQFSAYGGVYGLGLVTIIAAAMPAVLAFDNNYQRSKWGVGICILVIGLIWGGGFWRLSVPSPGYVDGIQLRLVQPNIPQHLKWKAGHKIGHVKRQFDLSTRVFDDGVRPSHIIWAETAVPFNLANDPRLLSYLGAAVPENGYLITGAPRATPPGMPKPTYWNSVHAIARTGKVIANYDKAHLVPFGEYVPFREILSMSKLTAGRVDFTPGEGARVWSLPGLPAVAPLVCYEAIFPAEVTSLGNEPEWLLNVTNDAWFGMSAGPYQHFAAVRFRAVEMGLPLVRVANTGISAVVDAYGRTERFLDLGQEGVVDSPLPRRLTERPLYGRYGDWITLIVILGALLGGIFLRASKIYSGDEDAADC